MCGMYWPIIWVSAENLCWKCRLYQLVHLSDKKTKQKNIHFNMDLHIPNTFRPMRRDSSTKHEDKLGSYDLMPNAKSYGLFSDNKG